MLHLGGNSDAWSSGVHYTIYDSFINVDFLNAGIYIVNMNLKNGDLISEKVVIL